ncbi:hypothetical protein BJV77DRAFT_964697 [Russula vinacea]|nr:hypothetical protein BJV77DRAFT_964697 [Russula vinacea]
MLLLRPLAVVAEPTNGNEYQYPYYSGLLGYYCTALRHQKKSAKCAGVLQIKPIHQNGDSFRRYWAYARLQPRLRPQLQTPLLANFSRFVTVARRNKKREGFSQRQTDAAKRNWLRKMRGRRKREREYQRLRKEAEDKQKLYLDWARGFEIKLGGKWHPGEDVRSCVAGKTEARWLARFALIRVEQDSRRMRGWIAAWKAGMCISARVRLHDGSSSQGVGSPSLGPTAVLVYALFCVRLTYFIVSPKISPPAFLLQKSLGFGYQDPSLADVQYMIGVKL